VKTSTKVLAAVFVLALGLAVESPAQAAISAQLAKQCRAMMIKAHPPQVFGSTSTGNAATERAYFSECVSRNADMSQTGHDRAGAAPASTTGQGR
jgi:K+-transporting ATPase c subunit